MLPTLWLDGVELCSHLLRGQGTVSSYTVSAEGELVIENRADPQIGEIQLVAKIGYPRDLKELDATCICFLGNSEYADLKRDGVWHWEAGERVNITGAARNRIIRSAKSANRSRQRFQYQRHPALCNFAERREQLTGHFGCRSKAVSPRGS